MVFSERDIDLLRLLCWCQYLPPEAACQICPEAEVQLLRSMGLVRQHRTSGALLLTTQGAEWLGGMAGRNLPRRGSRLFPLLSQERDSAAAAHLTSGADRLPGGRPYFHHIDGRTQRLSGAVLFLYHPKPGEQSMGEHPRRRAGPSGGAALLHPLCLSGDRQDSAHRRADGVQQSDGRLPGAPPGDGLCRGELYLCPLRTGGGISARGYQAHSLWRGVSQTAPSRSPALLRRHRRHPAPDPGDARLPPAAYPGRAEITIRPAAGGRTRPGRHVSGAPLRHGGGYGSAAH